MDNKQQGSKPKVSFGELAARVKAENDRKKTYSLSDVLAAKPAEQEAETHIMKALEKLKDVSTFKTAPDHETDRLYRDIATETISRASKSDDDDDDDKDDDDDDDGKQGGEEHNHKNNDDVEVVSASAPNPDDSRPLLNKGPSTNLRGKARFKNLISKQIQEKNSVEQTLFGLSNALRQMDQSDHDDDDDDKSKNKDKDKPAMRGHKSNPSEISSKDLEAQETHTEGEDGHEEEEETESEDNRTNGESSRRGTRKSKKSSTKKVADNIELNLQNFNAFVGSRKEKAKAYLRKAVMFIMLPSLGIAAFLFYVVENPKLCEEKVPLDPNEVTEEEFIDVFDVNGTVIGNATVPPKPPTIIEFTCPGLGASVSWWFLFLGARQIITFTLACITQIFVVDYLALASRFCLVWFGPVVTLFLVQSKGWPFLLLFWAVYDLLLLSGDRDFAHHWGYWQDYVGLFNEDNPSGNVVDNEWNLTILRLAIFVALAVALKRLFVALFLGRQTFSAYGEKLAEIMKKCLLVGEVATLAKDIEKYSDSYAEDFCSTPASVNASSNYESFLKEEEEPNQDESMERVNAAQAANDFFAKRDAGPPPQTASKRSLKEEKDEDFSRSQQMQLSELLDMWEEPQTAEQEEEKHISIAAVLQFRQSLAFMKVRFPFLPAFGLADTRENCIASAQEVYDRLLLRTPNQDILPFSTLALLAKNDNDTIDQNKAKLLIQAFRPDRQGNLTKLDFVKSVDTVYKSIKLLNANISNTSQIESAVEGLMNTIFYIIIGAITLAGLGVDPLQVFLSFSSVILAFAFMFGSSSSKYFEGIMFILMQKPYGVGDRIHLSRPEQETSIDGASGWIVEKVSLYSTHLYWGATNERATLANGAISNMKVINAARSPCAQIFVNMKFALDTPYEKIEIFKAAIEQYLKDRPREWLALVGFRPTAVAVEHQYINYLTIAQHRASWMDLGAVLSSKAELVTYELEVAKALKMDYSQPILPVDLVVNRNGGSGRNGGGSDDNNGGRNSTSNNNDNTSGELTPQDIQDLVM